jgi:hypothetical protein
MEKIYRKYCNPQKLMNEIYETMPSSMPVLQDGRYESVSLRVFTRGSDTILWFPDVLEKTIDGIVTAHVAEDKEEIPAGAVEQLRSEIESIKTQVAVIDSRVRSVEDKTSEPVISR